MARKRIFVFIFYVHLLSSSVCDDNNTYNLRSADTSNYPCLRNYLQQDAQKTCEDETLTALRGQLPKMLEFTASRGNPFYNLRLSLRDINLNVRENYARMIENTGKNTFPLLVATDSEPDLYGVGGVWKLYLKDGTMKRIVPVSPEYEVNKALSHMVLGVFSIVAPYFHSPNSINWQPALRKLQELLRNIEFLLQTGESGIPASDLNRAFRMTSRVNEYIDYVINKNAVLPHDFAQFGHEMAPLIEQCMHRATAAHAEGSIPALLRLKEELGEEEWRKLHVIIPAVWPVSLFNIRLQALEKVMSFDQIKSQVITIEGASSETDAKTTLGRIISDRVVAQMVWGQFNDDAMKDHVFSLSTRRDLLSSVASQALAEECRKPEDDKPRCPFDGRQAGLQSTGTDNLFATMLRS